MVTQISVNYYKISEGVEEPERATLNSACYDIKAYFHTSTVKAIDTSNNSSEENVMGISNSYLNILPGWRYLIPTGIIFDIPDDYSIRIHPRSGLAWKNGITVANCEGVVDSDYYHETFVGEVSSGKTPNSPNSVALVKNYSTSQENNFILKAI